jgi:hypothetical protein
VNHPGSNCSAAELKSAANRFVGWLDRTGFKSFDPYDVWGTSYGIWSRRVYYRNRRLGAVFVAPIVALDLVWPSARRLLVKRQRFATADAQVLMAFLNLHHVTGERSFLDRAVTLGEEILAYAISGYRGPCWGYPFDWEHGRGKTWKRNTPYITCTPYCYEAFVGLFEATQEPRYFDLAQKIADFVHGDLRDTPTSATASAGSYSPIDNSQVVNASAYRAWLLIDAGRRFGRDDFTATGLRNLNFVLESQRPDGSWLYALGEGASFIDNFHTCFNLKNLTKINRMLEREDITTAVRRGFTYYAEHLLYADGDPKSFAIEPRFQVARLEMYNFAEGITLGAVLGREIPESSEIAHRLAHRLIRDFQLRDGYFVTRVFRGDIRHTFPFLRWPQAQLFLAITNLLRSVVSRSHNGEVTTRPFQAVTSH